jgi:hypothetical protein
VLVSPSPAVRGAFLHRAAESSAALNRSEEVEELRVELREDPTRLSRAALYGDSGSMIGLGDRALTAPGRGANLPPETR